MIKTSTTTEITKHTVITNAIVVESMSPPSLFNSGCGWEDGVGEGEEEEEVASSTVTDRTGAPENPSTAPQSCTRCHQRHRVIQYT